MQPGSFLGEHDVGGPPGDAVDAGVDLRAKRLARDLQVREGRVLLEQFGVLGDQVRLATFTGAARLRASAYTLFSTNASDAYSEGWRVAVCRVVMTRPRNDDLARRSARSEGRQERCDWRPLPTRR